MPTIRHLPGAIALTAILLGAGLSKWWDADAAPHGYSDVLADALPHKVHSSAEVPEAVALYRKILAKQPDHSTTIVAIGAYTNLAGLLHSPGGTQGVFTELGKGGAAVINDKGGLSWTADTKRRGDRYVHVSDQTTLNNRIDALLNTGS